MACTGHCGQLQADGKQATIDLFEIGVRDRRAVPIDNRRALTVIQEPDLAEPSVRELGQDVRCPPRCCRVRRLACRRRSELDGARDLVQLFAERTQGLVVHQFSPIAVQSISPRRKLRHFALARGNHRGEFVTPLLKRGELPLPIGW